jgi:hypothetical protein
VIIKWKKKRRYGQIWIVETVFSAIKRMFGEYVSATKLENMIKEMNDERVIVPLI